MMGVKLSDLEFEHGFKVGRHQITRYDLQCPTCGFLPQTAFQADDAIRGLAEHAHIIHDIDIGVPKNFVGQEVAVHGPPSD